MTTLSSSSSSLTACFSSASALTFEQLAIKEVLADQHSDGKTIARILKLTYDRGTQNDLNKIIQSITEESGTFAVSEQVKDLLLDQGIQLIQRTNGSVLMREQAVLTYFSNVPQQ